MHTTTTLRMFLTAATLLLTPTVRGQDPAPEPLQWVKSYNEARELGRESNRPVLMFLTTDGCRHCVRMERESFEDQVIVRTIQQSFVPSMLHIDPNGSLAEQLKVTIFPTTLIIHPNGKILNYSRGYMSRETLRNRIDTAMNDARLIEEKSAAVASNR